MGRDDTLNWYIRAQDQTKGALESAKAGVRGYERQLDGLQNTLKGFGKLTLGVIAFDSLKGVASSIVDTQIKFDRFRNTLAQGVGMENVGTEMAYVSETSKTLGLDLETAGEQYARLTAASRGTELQGNDTRRIFEAVSKASVAFGLSAEQTGGALNALSQMISKGSVQSEELKGQLGERLPGAFQTFARSMGVSTEELTKLLEQGKVGIDSLRNFAATLDKEVSEAALRGADSMQAATSRMGGAWTDFMRAMTTGVAGDTVKGGIKSITENVEQLTTALQSLSNVARTPQDIFDRGPIQNIRNFLGGAAAGVTARNNPQAQVSGDISGQTASTIRLQAEEEQAKKTLAAEKALERGREAFGKLSRQHETDAQKTARLTKEITDAGRAAGASEKQIRAVIAEATKGPKGGKSAIAKINDDLTELENRTRKQVVGEREAFLTEISKKGATGAQLNRAKELFDEAEAFKASTAAAEKNNEEFDKAFALRENFDKGAEDFIRNMRQEAEEQEFLASMLQKSNAERQIELGLRQAKAAGISDAQLPQVREQLERTQGNKKLVSLIDAGEGEQLRQRQEDVQLLTDAYQKFLDTGGKEGITQQQYLDAITERLDLVADKTQAVDRYSQQMVQTFSSGFEEMLFAGGSASDMLEELLIDVAKLILRAQILGPLFSSIFNASGGGGGGGGGGTIFGAVMGLASGYASGGVGGAVTAGVGLAANRYAGYGAGSSPSLPNYDTSLDESYGAGGGMVKSTGGSSNFAITQNMTIGSNADEAMIRKATSAGAMQAKTEILSSMNRGGDYA